MKTIITILICIIFLSCKKSNTQQPVQLQSNNPINTNIDICIKYGACMDGIYEFKPNNVPGGLSDTIMTGCKFKIVFNGYHYPPVGHGPQDSLWYSIQPVNFSLNVFNNTYTDDEYKFYGYGNGIASKGLYTKSHKLVFFRKIE